MLKNQPFVKIDFEDVHRAVRGLEHALVYRLLPHAKKQGHEYVALNPTRIDRKIGSFRINAYNFKWADFATGDKGGDVISLWAYIRKCTQLQAAKEILQVVGRA